MLLVGGIYFFLTGYEYNSPQSNTEFHGVIFF